MMFLRATARGDGDEIEIERRFRGRVGAGRPDRIFLRGWMVDRPVQLRRPDLDEPLEVGAGHELLGHPDERRAVGVEEAPGLLPRHRALALRRERDDDLRPFGVEQFEQPVLLVHHVDLVIW